LKFPIQKAFGMVYMLTSMRKGMSSCELARQFGVHQETAWFFRRKVQKARKQGECILLEGEVEVDETQIGGQETRKPGRSKGKKALVEVAVEVDYSNSKKPKGTIKRAAASLLVDASGDAIKEIIDRIIHPDAVITTDGWRAHLKALRGRWHYVEDSALGKNF
jgi:transposase-like protein